MLALRKSSLPLFWIILRGCLVPARWYFWQTYFCITEQPDCDNLVRCDITIVTCCHCTSMQTHSSSKSSTNDASGSAPTNAQAGQHRRKATDPMAQIKAAKKSVELGMKYQWSPEEEECLIVFLVSRKAEAGDGGSFKGPVWNAAVLEMVKFPTKGPNKTTMACSSKYSCVCILTICCSTPTLLILFQLCAQYNKIMNLKELSGLGSRYMTELRMNIGVAKQSVWKEYIAVCLFRDPHYSQSNKY